MKEVEILVRVETDDFDCVRNEISKIAKFLSSQDVYDTYYFDPLRENLKPNAKLELMECFRIRKKGKKSFITYKVDNFDSSGKWLYSDENESEIEKYDEVKKIIENLGLKELVVVDMKKEFYENNDYMIDIEFVQNLGVFLEVESKRKFENNEEIKNEKLKIEALINSFGFKVSKDVGIGKPEMLIKKKANLL